MTATTSDTNPAVLIPVAEPEAWFVLPDTAEGCVKKWVAEDVDYDVSERRTVEEMEEGLLEAADFSVTPEEAKRIVAQYAPNAPRRAEAKVVTPNVTPMQFAASPTGAPIVVPEPKLTADQIMWLGALRKHGVQGSDWRNSFKGAGELEGSGSVNMYVGNFLPEGITLICGLPKEGKSWLALSVAKALTTGQPLFGKVGYEVPEPVPVLYLAAESGDGALKLRCERMKITKDKKMFLARTLSQGLMPTLDSSLIEEAIKDMRPVVVLETLIRFNDGTDEDSSTENRKLAEALFRLIALGAKAVVGIHHSRKDLDKKRPTKEAAVRGSGDGLAMVDAVWLVMQDSQLHQSGKGPNEVDVVGWGRDFSPTPIRLALTRKKKDEDRFEFAPGIVSCINQVSDFVWVQKGLKSDSDTPAAKADQIDKDVERLVTGNPTISRKELIEQTGYTEKRVKNALKRLGYSRKSGDATATRWVQSVGPFVGPSN
jgi:hypothetical protein